jgi:hypothetical protein
VPELAHLTAKKNEGYDGYSNGKLRKPGVRKTCFQIVAFPLEVIFL